MMITLIIIIKNNIVKIINNVHITLSKFIARLQLKSLLPPLLPPKCLVALRAFKVHNCVACSSQKFPFSALLVEDN